MNIGLVLAGGGAKGAYQIGVLRALDEAGIRPAIISGTSIGAFNAALTYVPQQQREAIWQTLATRHFRKLGSFTFVLVAVRIAQGLAYIFRGNEDYALP